VRQKELVDKYQKELKKRTKPLSNTPVNVYRREQRAMQKKLFLEKFGVPSAT